MTITTQARDLQLVASLVPDQALSCNIWELLNLRLSQVHPEAIGARYVHTVKVLLTKPTLGYSAEAELDELILRLALRSDLVPIRQTLESYTAKECPGWEMRSWWTTADLFDDNEPF